MAAAGQPISTTKNNTINYEIDKTVRYTKQNMGAIRRLSAAVVVNHRQETGKDGKSAVKPLPEAEMKQINDLVREAMGFSKERGDTLSVANAPFTASDKSDAGIPIWKDPENVSLARDLVKYLLVAGILAFIYFKIVQPLLKTMFPPPAEATAAGEGGLSGNILGEGSPLIAGLEGEDKVTIDHYAAKVQKARDIAQTDPKAVANIIKDWMAANG